MNTLKKFLEKHFFLILLIPLIVLLSITLLYPLIYAFITSFYKWNLHQPYIPKKFVGLSQYIQLFKDEYLLKALLNTVIYILAIIPLEMFLGILFALLLEGSFRGKNIFQMFLFVPVVLTPVGVGIIWKILLITDFGVIPYYLHRIGFPWWTLLSDPFFAKVCIIVVDAWANTPFVFIMILASLTSFDPSIKEAALMDGASKLQVFLYVTFPLIKPVIYVVILIRSMDVFRIFDTIYMLTSGGPVGRTESVGSFVIRYLFDYAEVGFSSAQAFFMLTITILMSLAISKAFKVQY
jgi:multiple sugar transport system permease protein